MRTAGLDMDRSLEIHLELIDRFRAGQQIRTGEVARRYGVSRRTAERYLDRVGRHVAIRREGHVWRRETFCKEDSEQ